MVAPEGLEGSVIGQNINGLILTPEQLEPISSTQIREAMDSNDYEKMVTNGWLTKAVSQYLQRHKENIYQMYSSSVTLTVDDDVSQFVIQCNNRLHTNSTLSS
jgi:hypothetical protein